MYSREIEVSKMLAEKASKLIMEVYTSDFSVTQKEKNMGPVTEADLASDRLIVEGLQKFFPEDRVVSEESGAKNPENQGKRVWFIDPLDGTREFVKKNGEFSIHIGLAVEGVPVFGLVYVPVTGECAYGGKGFGACYENSQGISKPLSCSGNKEGDKTLISSHHYGKHYEEIKRILAPEKEIRRGSVGGKVLRICLGEADYLFYSGNQIMVWDLCAPIALIEGACGRASDFFGGSIVLNFPDFKAERGILISNGRAHEKLTGKLKRWKEGAVRE